MYRIMNSSKRSFIVEAGDVLKGGKEFSTRKYQETSIKSKILAPGATVYEVSDSLGKLLSTYQNDGIVVVEIVKEKKGK